MITRRRLLVALSASLLAAPLAAAAQQQPTKTARIGYLSPRSGPSIQEEAFRQGLRELGYIEGTNIFVEYRWADWKTERMSAFAAELVGLKVDVIVATGGTAWVLAAKRATTTIPIVFTTGDPLRGGLVARFDRPGGNLTGVALLTDELNVKRLQLLKEAVPDIARVAVLVNPANVSTGKVLNDLEGAAQTLSVKLQVLEARGPREIDEAFSAITRGRPGALLVLNDPMLFAQRVRIVDLAKKNRLPAAYEWREFADAGGFLSYGASITDVHRRLVTTYVDKILKGAKPADLPVQQPTRFELVIKLKTAKALGVTIPPSVLARADHIIE